MKLKARLTGKAGEGKWLAVTVLLTAALSVFLLRTYLFRGYDFLSTGIMNDLIRANLPTYTHIYDSISSGGNFWSWKMGIGTSIFSHAGAILDPFVYILFLFGRDNIQSMFIWYQIAKFIAEAVACYYYLRYFHLDQPVCAFGSTLYAFSGYSVIMGNNFVLGTICVFCPLYLLGIERLLKENRFGLLLITLTATCLYSYYYFYISGIVCVIYLTIRFLMENGWKLKHLTIELVKLAILGVVSVGLSAFVVLPQLQWTSGSARLNSGKDTSFGFEMLIPGGQKMATAVARTFNLNLIGDAVETPYYGLFNDYFQMSTFVTAAWIPLCGQYLASCDGRKRGRFFAISAMCLYASSTSIFAFAANAFSTVSYRWMFILSVLIVLVCMLGVQAIVNHRGFYRKTLYISIVLALLLCGAATTYMYRTKGLYWYDYRTAIVTVIAVMMGLVTIDFVIFVGQRSTGKRLHTVCMLGCSLLAVLILFCESGLNYRSWYSLEPQKNGVPTGQKLYYDSSYDAIRAIQEKDASFYRINKDFDSVVTSGIDSDNDAMVQGYMGLRSYNPVNNSKYISFLMANDVYVVCPLNISNYSSNGIAPADVKGPDLNYINGVYDRYNLMSYLGVKYYVTRDPQKNLPENFEYLFQEQDCYVYLNTEYLPLAFTRSQTVDEAAFGALSTTEKEEVLLNAVVTQAGGKTQYDVLGTNLELAQMQQAAFELVSFDDDVVCFNLTVPMDAEYMVTSVPFDNDWSVYIDGHRVNTEEVNNGMLGVKLGQEYTGKTLNVELIYRPKALYTGCIISIITLGAILVYLPLKKKRSGRKDSH